MVKKIEMFEAADGTTHVDIRDAVRADLEHLFRQSTAINEASATALVSKLVGDKEYRRELIHTLDLLNAEIAPRVMAA